jgi:hypothetical protein
MLLLIVAGIVLGGPALPAAAVQDDVECAPVNEPSHRLRVQKNGDLSCATAIALVADARSAPGRPRHASSAPYRLPGRPGWTCYRVTGGGSCSRGPRRVLYYEDARNRVLVITETQRRCVDCSLAELSRPRGMRLRTAGFTLVASGLHWRGWKRPSAIARGVLRVRAGTRTTAAAGRITLSGLARHVPDGCGHTDLDRIYTVATIVLDGRTPRRFRGRFAVALGQTGCETA